MPMTDIVRYLNLQQEQHEKLEAANKATSHKSPIPFTTADKAVCARYGNFTLKSAFNPVIDVLTGATLGHSAVLQATHATDHSHTPVSSDAVFVLPTDDLEFVYLDRLVRTLHALNYLTQPRQGNLILRVHQRHILSVTTDHGLAFEEILRPCGLLPQQITLEIEINDVQEPRHLIQAVQNYRDRGYRIAIHRFGRHVFDFDLLKKLRPSIVRLDISVLEQPDQLPLVTEKIREIDAKSLAYGLKNQPLKAIANWFGVDLIEPEG